MDDIVYVAAYCRVSTSSKDQENSFENQKSYFEREINKSERYKLYEIYPDKGITGTSLNKRDEFTRMLLDAGLDEIKINKQRSIFTSNTPREPKFKLIFVKNTSRFARNVMVIEILRELLKKGVYVHFLDIDLLFDSPSKEFMLNLFLNFDQQDSIDKSTKVRFGHLEGARKGRVFSNSKIYGYKYLKEEDDENKFEIIEEEAQVIRRIYRLFIEGYGIRRIINYLDEHNIKTRNNKRFVPSMIKRILSNEKYYGASVRSKYTYGTVFNKTSYAKIKDESQWIVVEDAIPSIITKEEFEKVKEIRESKVNHINQKGIYKGISEFAGLIYCGECGNVYTRNIDRGRVFYNCKLKKQRGSSKCGNVNVQHLDIEKELDVLATGKFYEMFEQLKEGEIADYQQVVEDLKKKRDEKFQDEDVRKLANELSDLEEKKKRIAMLFIEGSFDREHLEQLRTSIDNEIEQKRKLYTDLTKSDEDIAKEIRLIEDYIHEISKEKVKEIVGRDEVLKRIDRMTIIRDINNKKKSRVIFTFKDNRIQEIKRKYNL